MQRTSRVFMLALTVCFMMIGAWMSFTVSWKKISETRIAFPSSIMTAKKDDHQSDFLQFDLRRRLANKIEKIQLDISRTKESGSGVVDGKWVLELSEIVAELDPRRRSTSGSSSVEWDFSARLPNMGPAPISKPDGYPRSVCPELYKFDKKNIPYFQRGMHQENCSYIPTFNRKLTILLTFLSLKHDEPSTIVNIITKYYDINIIVLVKNSSLLINSMPEKNIILEMKDSESDSDAISRAVTFVKTPFVLLGKSLSQFNNQSSLERLVRVLDEMPLVKVAGGAARDDQGRWIHGCLQQNMENYHATYKQGYYSSKYECMFCDDLLTPFVTYTELFEQVPLKKGLNGPLVFHDWFARLRYEGHLAVTCPDVMFYVHTHPIMTTSDWRRFAQIWSLTSIRSYNNTVLHFSCSEAEISCENISSSIKAFLIPPCCLKRIQDEMSYILDFADQNNIQYEMHAGSVLGAVKMGRHLPWDLDMDFIFACEDWNRWMKIMKNLKNRNCKLNIKTKNKYFVINCQTLFYEFLCYSNSSFNLSRVFLPEEFMNIPTKISFGDRWTSGISNPGLYSGNKYGLEDLRHAPHWRHLKKESKDGQYDNPGAWKKCTKPNHHACLDHFPADGNIIFLN